MGEIVYPDNPTESYIKERDRQVGRLKHDEETCDAAYEFTRTLIRTNYIKNFTWLGRPIMQYPSDLMVMQELIWDIKPDFIIETGVAFGGSAVFFASILEVIGKGIVYAIEKEMRDKNRDSLKKHNLSKRIVLFDGDSILKSLGYLFELNIRYYSDTMNNDPAVFVVLDSNHTEEHVLAELNLYSKFVSVGSYIVVCDTAIEYFDDEFPSPDRPWEKGNNPLTAVKKFMQTEMGGNFIVDKAIERRALVTSAPNGWLRRVK
jgi:cephalosporin hydroxylase